MRINSDLPQKIAAQQAMQLAQSRAAGLEAAKEPTEEQKRSERGDAKSEANERVRISPAAVLAARISTALNERTQLRSELVAHLREQIQGGTYRPDPARVAEGMIGTITGRKV